MMRDIIHFVLAGLIIAHGSLNQPETIPLTDQEYEAELFDETFVEPYRYAAEAPFNGSAFLKNLLVQAEPAPPAAVPPPAVPPADTKPQIVSPKISIKAPRSVEVGNLIEVVIEHEGAELRELDWTIDPEPDPKNIVPGVDMYSFHFTAPIYPPTASSTIYTIKATGVSIEKPKTGKGHHSAEARIQIRRADPPPQAAPQQTPQGGPTVQQLMKQWVGEVEVDPRTRPVELVEIVAAGKKASSALRSHRIEVDQVIDEWIQEAYLSMGDAAHHWDKRSAGPPFFNNMKGLFTDNARLPNAKPADLLDQLLVMLAGM